MCTDKWKGYLMKKLLFALFLGSSLYGAPEDSKTDLLNKNDTTFACMSAFIEKDISAIEKFLKNPDDLDFGLTDAKGNILLDYALQLCEDKNIVLQIYKHSKTLVLAKSEESPIFLKIIATGHHNIACDLMDSGRSYIFRAVDSKQRDALHYAVTFDAVCVIECLFKNKLIMRWDHPDEAKRTPFMLACHLQKTEIALFLLRNGFIDCTLSDKNRNSVYSYSRFNSEVAGIVALKLGKKRVRFAQGTKSSIV